MLTRYLPHRYFQLGVSHFLLNAFPAARAAFSAAHTHLRGNPRIEYAQLGLGFTLHEAEVLFNAGLACLRQAELDPNSRYGGNTGGAAMGVGLAQEGLDWLRKAWDAAQDAERGKGPREEHRVIEEALRDRGVGYTVFSVVSVRWLSCLLSRGMC